MILLHRIRTPRRKLFFPIGLISFSLFFILALQLLHNDPFFRKEYILEVTMLPGKLEHQCETYFNDSANALNISGNINSRKQALFNLDSQLKNDIHSNNRNKIIHVRLGEKASWGDFIAVINTIKKNKLNYYMVDGNDFWIHSTVNGSLEKEVMHDYGGHRLYKPFERPICCGLSLANDLTNISSEAGKSDSEIRAFNWRAFAFLFLVLCVVNLYRLAAFTKEFRVTNTLS